MFLHHHITGGSTLLMTGLKQYLSGRENFTVTQSFFSEKETIAEIAQANADIFWFDLAGWTSGITQFCKQIIQGLPKWKTVVFCNDKDPKAVREFLQAGVAVYLLPSCRTDQVDEAILSIANKNVFIDPQVRNDFTDFVFGIKNLQSSNKLTRRENEVLRLIIQEHTTQEIANKLYISFCTVETHRLHLIQKMGVKNTAGLVREAFLRQLC